MNRKIRDINFKVFRQKKGRPFINFFFYLRLQLQWAPLR
jgi:hypothetical protein